MLSPNFDISLGPMAERDDPSWMVRERMVRSLALYEHKPDGYDGYIWLNPGVSAMVKLIRIRPHPFHERCKLVEIDMKDPGNWTLVDFGDDQRGTGLFLRNGDMIRWRLGERTSRISELFPVPN